MDMLIWFLLNVEKLLDISEFLLANWTFNVIASDTSEKGLNSVKGKCVSSIWVNNSGYIIRECCDS